MLCFSLTIVCHGKKEKANKNGLLFDLLTYFGQPSCGQPVIDFGKLMCLQPPSDCGNSGYPNKHGFLRLQFFKCFQGEVPR